MTHTQTDSQTVLITGATSGIGRHAALYLAARGYRVIATGRTQGALDALAKEAREAGDADGAAVRGQLETLALDVTDPASIEAAARAIDERTDGHGVDVLINNAGYGAPAPMEMISDEDLRRQFEVNVFGLMAVTRAFVPRMRERGSGRVINVSSIGGRVTFPLFGAYHATKYAVEAMSDAMRMELAPFGVQVVVVEPGPIDTGFSARALDEGNKYKENGSPYAPVMERAEEIKEFADKNSVSPDCVSQAIFRAIRARRPRARYVAPLRAQVMAGALRALPTSWSDAVMRRFTGFTARRLSGAARPAELPTA